MIIEQSTKLCPKCGQSKSRDMFCRDRRRRDGLACWCRACLNESGRKFHAANREKVLERHRKWHAANPPDRLEAARRTRLWCEQNPEHAKLLRKNGKLKRRARTRGKMTATELREWAAAQPKVCHWCGIKCAKYDIDHRVPLSKGGEHERRNLVISCPTCNRRKGALCPVEFAQSIGRLL